MNLWRRVNTELAGAWRSLRYDLGRRPASPDGDEAADRGPEVTFTGMSTFGGAFDQVSAYEPGTGYATGTGAAAPGGSEFGRPPRRLAAVSVFVLLTLVGAAASYFAVVSGLGSLLRDKPDVPQSYPVAAGAPADPGAGSAAGLGGARPAVKRPETGTPVPAATTTAPGTPAVAGTTSAPATRPAGSAAYQPAPPRRTPPEKGLTPPVPTPTAPAPTATGPSPSPSPSPSASEPPSPAPTATGPSDDPRPSGEAFMRRPHRHGY